MKESFLIPGQRSHIHGVYMEEKGPCLEVSCSPGLSTYRIVRRNDGHILGSLYGVILREGGGTDLVVDKDTIWVNAAVPNVVAFERQVLDRIQGTFLVHTHTSLPRRVYPDTGGTIPLVFCPSTRRAGASAGMLLDSDEYRTRFLPDRVERLVRREGMGSWIPGTLTAHEGVKRLLCNHFLDLENWEMVRFWPNKDAFSQDMEVEEAVSIVATELPAFMRAAAQEFRIGITLTAGFDSRLMLAAARPVAEKLEFFTTTPKRQGIDQILSARMARDLGLRHRLVPLLPASDQEMERWDHAVGHAVLEGNRSAGPTLRSLNYDIILTGMSGELGRSRLYRQDYETINGKRVTPELVLSRLGRPQDSELLAEVVRWLEDLQGLPSSAVLDLAHMEFLGCCWAMAQHSAQCAAQLEMNPISQRAIRRAFISVPPEKKRTETLFRESIAAMWPELKNYPVNSLGTYRDAVENISKLFSAGRLRRYIRSRLS